MESGEAGHESPSFDATAAKKIAGVRQVIAVPSGVAVSLPTVYDSATTCRGSEALVEPAGLLV